MTETLHATAVAIAGRGVLLSGRSGSGKSDLALRLIDRGHMLISDDRVQTLAKGGCLLLSPPAAIAGLMEVRGLGLIRMPFLSGVAAALFVILDEESERLPQPEWRRIDGIALPLVRIAAFELSAPLKIERAVALAARQG